MWVQFKQNRKIDKTLYRKNAIMDASPALSDHWYFKALVKAGDVVLVNQKGKEEKPKAAEGKKKPAPPRRRQPVRPKEMPLPISKKSPAVEDAPVDGLKQ